VSIAYLSLGSNINARSNINAAIAALRKGFTDVSLSPVFRSPAAGFEGDKFINLVAQLETLLSPLELKQWLNELEDRQGRKRDVPKFSDRSLDIDILLYDDLYLLSPVLEIPHRDVLSYAHVLKPLADLAPKLLHPACRKTIAELWNEFPGQDYGLELIDL